MEKLRKIFWKYLVENRIPLHPRIEDKDRFWRGGWGVAPRDYDKIGYKIFGVSNFIRYLAVLLFILLILSGVLTSMSMLSVSTFKSLASSFGTLIFGIIVVGGILGIVYHARYGLWFYVGFAIVVGIATVALILVFFSFPIKSMTLGVIVILILVWFLYFFIFSKEGPNGKAS